MKQLIILISLIFATNSIFSQDSSKFFFDEFNFSFNKINLNDKNIEDMNGFGFGIYHTYFANKPYNVIFGLEYNLTRYFIKYVNIDSPAGHGTNETDNLNSLVIPCGLRYSMGYKIKFFIESSVYLDLLFRKRSRGTMLMNVGDLKEYQYENKESTASLGYNLGLGIQIPISTYYFIIKPDYCYSKFYSSGILIYNKYFRISLGIKIF